MNITLFYLLFAFVGIALFYLPFAFVDIALFYLPSAFVGIALFYLLLHSPWLDLGDKADGAFLFVGECAATVCFYYEFASEGELFIEA